MATQYYQKTMIPADRVPGATKPAKGAAYSLWDLLKRPEHSHKDIAVLADEAFSLTTLKAVEINAKYAGYIDRQAQEIAKTQKHLGKSIPGDFDYNQVQGLSNEARQLLMQIQPICVDQASRISGITPATISLLLVALKRQGWVSA